MNRREQWARNIALLTGALVALLAVIFAALQNPLQPPTITPQDSTDNSMSSTTSHEADAEKIAAGRRVFETQGCMRCHAIANEGNPRIPLDDVGNQRSAEAIKQWIIAPAELKAEMSSRIFQTKQAYSNLPAEDIDALVAYLQSIATMQQPEINHNH